MTYNSILCKSTGEEQYVHNIHNRNRHNRTDPQHHGRSNVRTIYKHAGTIMNTNPHYTDMIAARKAYDDHTYRMHAKYGHLHSDDRLTVEEAEERRCVKATYDTHSSLYVACRDLYGV